MAQYFARIVRALIVSTLGFGGGVGLLVLIFMLGVKHDPLAVQFAWKAGLIIGLLFAFMLVAVLLPLDLTAHLFLAKGLYTEIWELEQVRDVIVEGSLREVLGATRLSLLTVPYVKSVSDDVEHMVTRATTGPSWRSAGEDLEVELNPIKENMWKLRCTSRSRSKNVVFDYGKNYENVETWQKNLHAKLQSGATPA
ncbi:MAG TPA: hypothetical protein V6C97_23250 [Oculatellaceae cyanobacterium]